MKKQRLFIVGANAFGLELADASLRNEESCNQYDIKGFLHHGSHQDTGYLKLPVLGDWMDYRFEADDVVLIGTADIEWKKKIVQTLSGRVQFGSYVHDFTQIHKSVKIGLGSVILDDSAVGAGIVIGDFVTMNPACRIGHGTTIGNYSTLLTRIDVSGNCQIGDEVLIGTGAILAPKVKVGNQAQIAIGSVVMCHVGIGRVVMGNPAVAVCKRSELPDREG